MASFDPYQTVREIHRSGFTVIYSGRTTASSEAKYAIKVFQPSALLLETEQAKIETDLFLNSAQIQQKTSASGAQYWAPIHKCDSIPDGAFYVTDKYDRSLQQLIDTNITLTPQAFHKIIESIVKGLIELKQACGRPHGNLKTTNILIAGKGDISQTKIVLSDPLPDEHIDTEVHWDVDLREIAEFIYQLVIHRPLPNVDGWQAPDSKEWTKLGKQAQEWRNLCNRLLVSHMKPGTMSLDILIRELDRIQKIKPVLSTRRLIIAAVLVVIAVVTLFCLKPIIFPAPPAKLEDWNPLLKEYLGWIEELRMDLGGTTENERRKHWKRNDLSAIVENIIGEKTQDKEKASLPYYASRRAGLQEQDLEGKTIEELIEEKAGIYDKNTKIALKAIEVVKCFFDPISDPNSYRFFKDPNLPKVEPEYQKWSLLLDTQQIAKKFQERGWQRSATFLQNLINSIQPDPNIAENVDKILELQTGLGDIKSCWTDIETNEKIIENSGDLFLTVFNNYIQQEPSIVFSDATKADVNNVGKKLRDELQNRKQSIGKLTSSINENWQKLENNQEIIKSTNNRILAKYSEYIQLRLESTNLEILGEKLKVIRNSSDKLSNFISENWQKLNENQKKIIDTGYPIIARFPDYMISELDSADTGILSGEAELDILVLKLEKINSMADTLAKFDWQRIDKATFLNDHGNDSEELLKEETFTERLNLIKTYSYLVPDPRDMLYKLVEETQDHIKQATEHNPQPAKDCANNLNKFLTNIKELGEFRGIKKEEGQINEKINYIQPAIEKINETAISLIEAPEDWLRRIRGDSRIVSSEALNEKWIELRDKVIIGHTADELTKDKTLYQQLRERVKGTKENIVKLNGILTRELPSQIDVKLREKVWNSKLKELYDEERNKTTKSIVENIRLKNEIPDINEPSFMQFSQRQFSSFQQLQVDLGGILDAFNKIEDGFNACYLLDQKLPESDQTVRLLWNKWKDTDILKDTRINEALTELTKRIKDLEDIEKSNNRDTLGNIATDSDYQTEAVYAAWTRLGEFTNPLWPTETEELETERRIQERLKGEFKEFEETRAGELLTKLAEVALEREIVFKKANIGRFRETIEENFAQDKILGDITRLISTEINILNKLVELEALESLTNKLAEFVSKEDWQMDRFRKDLFRTESEVYKSYSSISNNNLEVTVENWLKEVQDYKIVKDPREGYQWDKKITEITQLIEKELKRKQGGSSKQNLVSTITGITKLFENVLGGEQTSSEEQSIQKLKLEYDKFTKTAQTINAMRIIPAIEKNKNKIETGICNELWKNLLDHEAAVRSIIKPEYCKYLELAEGEVQRLVFAATTELSAEFEPINIRRLQSISEKDPPLKRIFTFVQGSAESLLGLSRVTELPLSQLGEFFNRSVEVAGWERIRQAVKNNEIEWLNFFDTTDLSKTKNVGWPRYIVSKKDPSLILRFIPAGGDNQYPFYMATHEITNAQYRLFLEKTGARSQTRLSSRSLILGSQSNKYLIQSDPKYKPCGIKWDRSTKTFMVTQSDINIPVVYVTYFGAQSYAEWFGGQLPTASQHQYACKADTNSLKPWANNPSEIASYSHVRAGLWLTARDDYNEKRSRLTGTVEPPIGAVKPEGFIPFDKDEDKSDIPVSENSEKEIVHEQPTTFNSAWPVASVTNPNDWGFYDMIGNVWEWCHENSQPVICGGSCLAPPEYIHNLESNYTLNFNDRACDVGFRIIVPAR
jgi:formylglycine-generating enzyme required for sulfatase activity